MRRRNESTLLGWMLVKNQRLERSQQNLFLQNFKTGHTHTHTHTHTRELAPSPKGPLAEPTIDVSQIPILRILEVCFLNEISPFQVKQDVHS